MEVPPEILLFIAIGLAAQTVDGALGMAYGVTSSSLLLTAGLSPALASASVHAAEVATTGVSGLSHGLFGNVHMRLLWKLALPGAAGGLLGAWFLGSVDLTWIRPLVAAYLLVVGARLIVRAWRQCQPRVRAERALSVGFGAGFLDAVGGGGWGSMVTSHLLDRQVEPRLAIGTANAAEFFVSAAISAVFLATLGVSHVHVVLGLLIGGVIAAPFAAWLTRRLPARPLMGGVGALVVALSLYNLLR